MYLCDFIIEKALLELKIQHITEQTEEQTRKNKLDTVIQSFNNSRCRDFWFDLYQTPKVTEIGRELKGLCTSEKEDKIMFNILKEE